MSEIEWMNIFGDNLRDILKDYNMSQLELADAAGIAEGSISNYINKRSIPSLRNAINISHALGLSMDELLYFEDKVF